MPQSITRPATETQTPNDANHAPRLCMVMTNRTCLRVSTSTQGF